MFTVTEMYNERMRGRYRQKEREGGVRKRERERISKEEEGTKIQRAQEPILQITITRLSKHTF
jgi:hypothetical protein